MCDCVRVSCSLLSPVTVTGGVWTNNDSIAKLTNTKPPSPPLNTYPYTILHHLSQPLPQLLLSASTHLYIDLSVGPWVILRFLRFYGLKENSDKIQLNKRTQLPPYSSPISSNNSAPFLILQQLLRNIANTYFNFH